MKRLNVTNEAVRLAAILLAYGLNREQINECLGIILDQGWNETLDFLGQTPGVVEGINAAKLDYRELPCGKGEDIYPNERRRFKLNPFDCEKISCEVGKAQRAIASGSFTKPTKGQAFVIWDAIQRLSVPKRQEEKPVCKSFAVETRDLVEVASAASRGSGKLNSPKGSSSVVKRHEPSPAYRQMVDEKEKDKKIATEPKATGNRTNTHPLCYQLNGNCHRCIPNIPARQRV